MEQFLLYKIHITGRVQGVGFRWSAAREAMVRNLTGYVKNLPDGSVYIEAEGTREMLDDYLKWCRRGPRLSVVKSVAVEAFPPVNYTDFRIQ